MERLWQDVSFGARSLRRRAGTASLAIFTCALGVGAATAMFSVVDGVMLRPLPFDGADRLVMVYPTIEEWRTNPVFADNADRAAFSKPEYTEWHRRQKSFEYAAALSGNSAVIQGGGEPTRIGVGLATDELFPMLSVRALHGRLYTAEEVQREADVVLLTHSFWRSRFGARREVIGQTLRLDDATATIIGVLPPAFDALGFDDEVWRPINNSANEDARTNHDIRVLARLAPGVTLERAQAETASILTGISLETREKGHDITHKATVASRLEEQTRDVKKPLSLLILATAVLLLAACVAVAGLLLGAGIDRETELAVRGALGANSSRLVRQLLTENLMLAAIGGACGVVLAVWLTKLLLLVAPPDMPRIDEVGVNLRVLVFTVGCTGVVGLLFGLVPALSLGRVSLTQRMGTTRATSTRRTRLHAALVTIQVAIGTLMLGGAGLLVRTMIELNAVEPGFESRNVVMMRLSPPWSKFNGKPPEAITQYFEEIRSALAGAPGVDNITVAGMVPFSGSRWTTDVSPAGYHRAPGEVIDVSRHSVSSDYFDVLSIRLTDGRYFTEAEDRPGGSPVTVISRRFADKFWPGQPAVGKQIDVGNGKLLTVVGVVEDTHDEGLTTDVMPRFYIPRQQDRNGNGTFAIRTEADPALIIPDLKKRVWSVDPSVPITKVETMERLITQSIAPQRYRARLITAFAAFAVVFSLLAVYGVVNRSVAGRTPELALRLALGAQRGQILRMILRQGWRLAFAGVVFGVGAFVLGARVLSAFLFGTEPLDPLTIVVIAAMMMLLAILAVLPPSLRAARTMPWDAMRAVD